MNKVKVYHLANRDCHNEFCMDPDPHTAKAMFKKGLYYHAATILRSNAPTNDAIPKLNEALDLTTDEGWQYKKQVQCAVGHPEDVRLSTMGDIFMLNRRVYLATFKGWHNITNSF